MSATPHTVSFLYRNKKAEGHFLYSKGLPRSGYLSHTLLFIRYNGKTIARKYQSIIDTKDATGAVIPNTQLIRHAYHAAAHANYQAAQAQ
jgi:hypothetical protein